MKCQNKDVLGKHRKQVDENGVHRGLKRRSSKRYKRTEMLISASSYEIFIENSPLASYNMRSGYSKMSRTEPWPFSGLIKGSCVEYIRLKKKKKKGRLKKKKTQANIQPEGIVY